MAEDPLHDIIEAVRARLKTELETQLQAVSDRHQQALDDQRNRIEAEAEQLWAPQLQAARAEVERQAEAAAAANVALEDLQQLLARERALAESRLEDERRAAAAQLDQRIQEFEVQRAQHSETRTGAAASIGSPDPASLVERIRGIDDASSVSASLAAIVDAASLDSTRAALYIVNGTRLEQWDVANRVPLDRAVYDVDAAAESITVDAFRGRQPVGMNGSACAIPLLLDGIPIAVLYGEVDPEGASTAGWAESLETVARHGAARLGYLTALRTAQARQWIAESGMTAASSTNTSTQPDDTVASARRYARLVVSEIKLYNERAVEEGRSHRDLMARLGPQIDRARRLFEEHVPVSVPRRSDYFQQELIQTLAGGDPSLLG